MVAPLIDRRGVVAGLAATCGGLASARAERRTRKPRVPAGLDAGGAAVALVGPGIDYTARDLAGRLARDGEGDLIGWDFIDRDGLPFETPSEADRPGSGTTLARTLLASPGVGRLVAVRIGTGDVLDLGRLVVFLSRSPARVALLTATSPRREDWSAFGKASEHLPGVLWIIPAGDDGGDLDVAPVYPAGLALGTSLVVTSANLDGALTAGARRGARTVDVAVVAGGAGTSGADAATTVPPSVRAAAAIAAAAVVLATATPELAGAKLKQALLARAAPMKGTGRGTTRRGWIAEPARLSRGG